MEFGIYSIWLYYEFRRRFLRYMNFFGGYFNIFFSEVEEEDVFANLLDFLRDFVLNEKGQLNNSDFKKFKQKLNQLYVIIFLSFNRVVVRVVMIIIVVDNVIMVIIFIVNKK